MTATDAQVRLIMNERARGKTQEQAAAKANIGSRKTVWKYERVKRLPSDLKQSRGLSNAQDSLKRIGRRWSGNWKKRRN